MVKSGFSQLLIACLSRFKALSRPAGKNFTIFKLRQETCCQVGARSYSSLSTPPPPTPRPAPSFSKLLLV